MYKLHKKKLNRKTAISTKEKEVMLVNMTLTPFKITVGGKL